MTITYYTNFSKRKNSTKQPTGGTDLTVRLKEPTSIENPTFITTTIPTSVNYIKWGTNYYYVEDIKYVTNDIIEIECSMDVLATNKSNIVGSSQFVKYYTHANTEIVDSRLSTKTTPIITPAFTPFSVIGEGVSYFVTVTGKDSVKIFACDKSTVDDLLPSSVGDSIKDNWDARIDEIEGAEGDLGVIFSNIMKMKDDVENSLYCFDTAQNSIKNCYTLPIALSNVSGDSGDITLGRLETTKSGTIPNIRIIHDSATVNIPWKATDWRRNAPYHNIYLYIPYIGLINIPVSEIIDSTTITVNVSLDLYSGATVFQAVASNGTIIGHYSTNLSSSYAIGSSNIDTLGSAQNLLGSTTQAITGAVDGNVAGIVGGALGIVNSVQSFNTCIGSNTGMAGQGLGNNVRCISVFHDTTVTPSSVSAIKGTPYNGVMNIPSSGYVECAGASIPSVAYGREKDSINAFLNGGVYIE